MNLTRQYFVAMESFCTIFETAIIRPTRSFAARKLLQYWLCLEASSFLGRYVVTQQRYRFESSWMLTQCRLLSKRIDTRKDLYIHQRHSENLKPHIVILAP